MKLRIITWITVFLIFIITPPALAAPDQQNPAGFTDINGHWASEAIVLCNIYGLMDGYPDKQFKPDNSLSRAEALTYIGRSLGWSIQASVKGKVESGSLSEVPRGFRGYIELSAEKQLITRDDIVTIDFNRPATRLEVTVWLARALNLNGSGSALKYSDLYTIPVSHLNPLAGVVEAGIISGLPENRFNPSGPLSRAEMAAMLLKMLDSGKVTPITGHHLLGKLVLKDRNNNKISLQTAYGTFTYGIAPYFMAFMYGASANLDQINVGDNVRVTLNRAQKCQVISYYSGTTTTLLQMPPSQGAYTLNGTVKSFDGSMLEFQTAEGASVKLPLSPAIRFTEYGHSATVSSLTGGKSGSITVSDGRVLKADLYSQSIYSNSPGVSGNKGYVINKYRDSFSVRLDNGTVRVLWLQEGISFLKNGQSASYSALKSGNYVELKAGQPAETVSIIEATRKAFGIVELVNTQSLTVRDDENRTVTRNFGPGAEIKDLVGYTMVTDDILVGSDVEMTLDSNDVITAVLVKDSYGVPDGTVEDIWISGNRWITITDGYNSRRTYYMRENVTVTERGVPRNIDSVMVGMKVRLSRDSYDYVTEIEITGTRALEGRISYINSSGYGSGQIQIQKSSGSKESYYLAASVLVRDGYSSRSTGYLTQGMNVRLTLDSSNLVTVIDIMGAEAAGLYVEGRITYFNSSSYGSGQIQIQRTSGRTESYYLATSVMVKEGYSSRSTGYLTQGMNVRLTLDSLNRVSLIEIISSEAYEGSVTYIHRTGAKRIEIRRSSGVTASYYLYDSVLVREGANDRTLDYISENMNVSLTLDSRGYVTRIDITSAAGPLALEGRVTYINRSGTGEIRILGSSGRTDSYYLAAYIQVRDGSASRSINYVTEGMNVRLSLDSANRVTLIDITSSSVIEGVVTYFRNTGSRRIEIRDNSGRLEIYYLPEGITIRDWGVERSLDSLRAGMRVKLYLGINDTPIQLEITGY